MRDVGLEMRQEFEEAVEAVEETITAPPPTPKFPADVMAKFEITESDLKAMAERAMPLKIAGANDKQGYAVARATRLELRDARIKLDKIRKAGNEDAREWIKLNDSVAKYLIGIITPAEERLDAEEAAYNAEVERIKAEKQREADAKLQKRIEELQAFGQPFTLSELTLMTDTQYGFLRATAEDAFKAREALRIEAEAALAKAKAEEAAKAEAERKAKEEAERIERERVAKQAAENAKAAAALEAERAKLRAEQEAFEAKQRAREQAEREKQIAEEAAAKAKEKAEREAREAAERAERERVEAEARRKAQEAARPDAEKILALAKVIREIALPKASTDAGRAVMAEIETSFGKFAAYIEGKANALSPITPKAP